MEHCIKEIYKTCAKGALHALACTSLHSTNELTGRLARRSAGASFAARVDRDHSNRVSRSRPQSFEGVGWGTEWVDLRKASTLHSKCRRSLKFNLPATLNALLPVGISALGISQSSCRPALPTQLRNSYMWCWWNRSDELEADLFRHRWSVAEVEVTEKRSTKL